MSPANVADMEARITVLDADLEAGRIEQRWHDASVFLMRQDVLHRTNAYSYAAAVYLDTALAG